MLVGVLLLTGCMASKKLDTQLEEKPPQAQTPQADLEPEIFYESLGTLDDPPPPTYTTDEPSDLHIIGEEMDDEIIQEDLSYVEAQEIPIIVNLQVQKWLDYFQGRGRKHFHRWLARSGRYIPMMKRILNENGLPEDLVYLSMIESGFSTYAYSRAKAVGQWQFIYPTGVRYGLKVNWWIDERRDPVKSTIAAAQYLKDLYNEFQHWYLAAAGYNAGEGKIARAIKRFKSEDFWEISKFRYLKPETKNYVPKLIAAAMIAKDHEAYGFTDIDYQEPLSYEKVNAPKAVSLTIVAKALGVSLKELKNLNPELVRGVTPPKYPNYELKVPMGMKGIFLTQYAGMPEYKPTEASRHRVRSGEALSVIARKYGTTASRIASYNNLRSRHSIRAGQVLKIPVGPKKAQAARKSPPKTKVAASKTSKTQESYKVRSGDSFWTISRQFDLTVSQLRRLNPNVSPQRLKPGQKLTIQNKPQQNKVAQNNPKASSPSTQDQSWKTYRVRNGDNLWVIAKRLGLPLTDLARWNNLNPKTAVLYPGKKLKFKL